MFWIMEKQTDLDSNGHSILWEENVSLIQYFVRPLNLYSPTEIHKQIR